MNSKSFTLIELMTVVAIMAILSGITLIGFNLFLKQGKIAKSMAFDSSIHFNLGYAIKGDWKMNDNAANSTVVDTSGNNNDGTFYSGGSPDNTANHSVDGANDTALEFDGTDDYVKISNDSSLQITGDLTISVWFNMNDASQAPQGIVDKTYMSEFRFEYYGVNDIILCEGDGTNYDCPGFNPTISSNTWYHVTAVRDASKKEVYFYLNGANAVTDSYSVDIVNSNYDVHIGKTSGRPFNGSIDQVRIYSEAFSFSQVKYQYYTGLQRLYDKGLMPGKEYKSRIVKLTSES